VEDDDFVQAIFDGLPPSWDTFLASVNARESHPNFECLWHDFLQDEGRMTTRSGPSNEENVALTADTRRGKKSSSQKNFHKKFQRTSSKESLKERVLICPK
jgi:hypothetical protein